jgi:ferredoxin-NADP reductase
VPPLLLTSGTTKSERQYSLTGPQLGTDRWQIAVRRQDEGRGGSLWIHNEVAVGDSLRVGVPRNHFRFVDAPGYVFVAGGIGITPILPMLDRARRSDRPWRLHYIGRSLDSMPFRDLVEGAETVLWDTNRTGRPGLDYLVQGMPPGSAVYCCGPESLLDDIEDRSVSGSGPWSNLKLRVERFAPRVRTSAGGADDTAFDVDLQRSGRTVHVERDCSLLDALQAADVLVPSTCREGTCGSCETAVLAGEIDHRDSVLDPDERARNDAMMVCVSRARSPRLVLDL